MELIFGFGFVSSAQLKIFVDGLFHLDNDIPQFKEHLRDFLVQIKVRIVAQYIVYDCFHSSLFCSSLSLTLSPSSPWPCFLFLFSPLPPSLPSLALSLPLHCSLPPLLGLASRFSPLSSLPPLPCSLLPPPSLQEFSGSDPAGLFLDMRETQIQQAAKEKRKQQLAVPGIINPHDRPDEMQE